MGWFVGITFVKYHSLIYKWKASQKCGNKSLTHNLWKRQLSNSYQQKEDLECSAWIGIGK